MSDGVHAEVEKGMQTIKNVSIVPLLKIVRELLKLSVTCGEWLWNTTMKELGMPGAATEKGQKKALENIIDQLKEKKRELERELAGLVDEKERKKVNKQIGKLDEAEQYLQGEADRIQKRIDEQSQKNCYGQDVLERPYLSPSCNHSNDWANTNGPYATSDGQETFHLPIEYGENHPLAQGNSLGSSPISVH